ncbi:MAG: hypothetical protein ACO1TE_27200 [Prosthecobacter sp.]
MRLKLARKHKGPLFAAALLFASIIVGLCLTIWQAMRASKAEHVAESRLQDSQLARGTAESIINDMLHDMRDRLEPLGKLELLDQVSGTAQRYFDQLPPEQRTPAALFNQCVAWRMRAEILEEQGKLREAGLAVRKALGLARELAAAHPDEDKLQRNLADTYNLLAEVIQAEGGGEGEGDAEVEALQARHAIHERLALKAPDDRETQLALASSHRALAWAARNRDDSPAALARLRQAVAIEERLLAKTPDDERVLGRIVISHTMTGSVLRQPKTRDNAAALAADRQALEHVQRLVRLQPEDVKHQRSLGTCHEKVAWDLRATGDLKGMMEHRELQLGIMKRLAQHDPGNLEWLETLAYAHWHMSDAQGVLGNHDGEVESLRRSLEIYERLVTADPGNMNWCYHFWDKLSLTCVALKKKGSPATAALDLRRKAAQTSAPFAAESPNWAGGIASNEAAMGEIHLALGQSMEAMRLLHAAYETQSKLAQTDPENEETRRRLTKYEWGLASAQLTHVAALLDTSDAAGAVNLARQALAHMSALLPGEKDTAHLDASLQLLGKTAGKLRQHLPSDSIISECERMLAALQQEGDQQRTKRK